MIRIRDKYGKEIPISEDATFIEICTKDGEIGYVYYCPDENKINLIAPNSKEAALYANRFGLEFTKRIINLGDRYKDI